MSSAFLLIVYFNPRSPCGERRIIERYYEIKKIRFQSTLPVRGATRNAVIFFYITNISIHAPRAGSDQKPFLREGLYF